MSNSHTLETFLRDVLINSIKAMVNNPSLHYLAFGSIATGIEFLGACEDDREWHEQGLAKKRFREGINRRMKVVNPLYGENNDRDFLYLKLRCGMAHVLRPSGGIALVGSTIKGSSHLKKNEEGSALVLVLPEFFSDFKESCEALLEDIADRKEDKFQATFLRVMEVPATGDTASYTVSSI